MRHRIVGYLAATAALVALAAPAPAEAQPDPCEVATEHTRQVISTVQLDRPDGWTVELVCGADHQWGGVTRPKTSTIMLNVEMGWPNAEWLRWGYVHELGHAYDPGPDSAGRLVWYDLRDIPYETAWSAGPQTLAEWTATPAEDWAEAFALCLLGDSYWGMYRSALPPPTGRECELMQLAIGQDFSFRDHR